MSNHEILTHGANALKSMLLMSGDVSKRALDRVMTSSESNLEDEPHEVTKDEVRKGWLRFVNFLKTR